MNQTAGNNGIVNEKLETAIDLGCCMVSRAKKVRKKLGSSRKDDTSLKESLKELDMMSMELIDKLFEISARIDLSEKKTSHERIHYGKFRGWINRLFHKFRKRIEKMKLAYQDMYTL